MRISAAALILCLVASANEASASNTLKRKLAKLSVDRDNKKGFKPDAKLNGEEKALWDRILQDVGSLPPTGKLFFALSKAGHKSQKVAT